MTKFRISVEGLSPFAALSQWLQNNQTKLRVHAQLFADPPSPYENSPLFGEKPKWQMTLQEYLEEYVPKKINLWRSNSDPNTEYPEDEQEAIESCTEDHREAVRKALYRGEPVPPEVLQDYPELDFEEPTPLHVQLTNLDYLQRPNHVYRGMSKAEYDATVAQGRGVQSDRRWCFENEGTCFATDPGSSAYYIFGGRTSPKITGEPVYLVEVAADSELMHKDTDSYVKTKDPAGWIPMDHVTRSWEITYNPEDDFYYIRQL